MGVTFVRQPGLTTTRVVAILIGIMGPVLMLLGGSMKVVTVGRLSVNLSLSISQVFSDASTALNTAAGLAIFGILLSQVPLLRILAAGVAAIGAAGVGGALLALQRVNEPDYWRERALTAFLNPRPASGFYVLVLGGILTTLAGITTLVSRRERYVAVATTAAATSHPDHMVAMSASLATPRMHGAERIPVLGLPVAGAGWFPDPDGSGRARWWTGTSWAEAVASSAPLPPPSIP